MSHFTVLVKVSPKKLAEHDGVIEHAVRELLAPYQENNCGDCPEVYLEFNNRTEEVDRVCAEVIKADSYMGKEHPESIGTTGQEQYGSRSELVKHYFGYEFDREQGGYGYWENPNAKWDWYQIGGRWAGMLPNKNADSTPIRGEISHMLKEEFDYPTYHGDAVALRDLDFSVLQQEANDKLEKFYASYLRWKALQANPNLPEEEGDAWLNYSLHETLIDIGARKVIKHREPLLDKDGQQVKDKKGKVLWSEPVFEDKELTLDYLRTECKWFWEFGTYAVVETDGTWKEKGEMGWFGCSSETPEEGAKWDKSYYNTFLKNEDLYTLLVVVDCHI